MPAVALVASFAELVANSEKPSEAIMVAEAVAILSLLVRRAPLTSRASSALGVDSGEFIRFAPMFMRLAKREVVVIFPLTARSPLTVTDPLSAIIKVLLRILTVPVPEG